MSVKDLAYISNLIAHNLQVFKANLIEKHQKKIITNQPPTYKQLLSELLGKLIISIVLFALACASYALC